MGMGVTENRMLTSIIINESDPFILLHFFNHIFRVRNPIPALQRLDPYITK